MALYVNTNISSLNSQRRLYNSTNVLNTNYQRLASGLRINSAKDDAAGLLISNRLTSQINGLNQANRNNNDAIALAQTVEGALDETSNMLQRVRTLAVQAANGTNTDADREALQKESNALCEEIARISRNTTYAGAQILDGKPQTGDNSLLDENGKVTFQVGANHHDTITLDLSVGFCLSSMAKDGGFDLYAGHNTQVLSYPDGTDAKARRRLLNMGMIMKDSTCDVNKDGEVNPALRFDGKFLAFSVSSYSTAQATLKNIDAFINYVDGKRSDLGAIQNRMEATIRNQSSIAENESDARSRIRDTDFAAETASLTANQILQQASQTVLTQANQRPTIALNLLGGA